MKPTSCDVKRTSRGAAERPASLISGQWWYLAKFTAYMLDIEPPGRKTAHGCYALKQRRVDAEDFTSHSRLDEMIERTTKQRLSKRQRCKYWHLSAIVPALKIPSPPSSQPTISIIFLSTASSIRVKTGATSYVYLRKNHVSTTSFNLHDFKLWSQP